MKQKPAELSAGRGAPKQAAQPEERTATAPFTRSPAQHTRHRCGPPLHSDVRKAVCGSKARVTAPKELPTAEACLAALKLGWQPGELKGDKLSMAVEDARGVIQAVAICARPCHKPLDDGLTVELRCLVSLDGQDGAIRQVMRALSQAAIRRGYRRLLVRDLVVAERSGLEGSWTPAPAPRGPFMRWANVMRGDGFR
ncbi:hypothetical protein [Piscinibacter gummiphilus]|uniref:Uncharacterized protein n=1 Tax=Piscinibacter gummiphilus TaxID=946333 RepID=A0ABZ0D262_9BURK|nr:hypothetical protein [Piscinibacter gummiphilus]WOB11273.1 hypothetical protein RXV79_26950 [Piscinibacter gummiphilus]